MRVPIYPQDLPSQAAFKKLARGLQMRWPGKSPIQLSHAIQVVSKGLGYADYREVRSMSLTWPLDAPAPSIAVMQIGIAAAIASHLKSSGDISLSKVALGGFVKTLPLNALTTVKRDVSNSGQPMVTMQSKLIATNDQAPSHNHAPQTSVAIPSATCKQFPSISMREKTPLNFETIKKAVFSTDNFREKCIFTLMELGVRAHEIRSMKVSQFSFAPYNPPSSAGSLLTINGGKSRSRVVPIYFESAELIEHYIASESLLAEDYLFPSSGDRKQVMLPSQLARVFRDWEKRAKLSPGSITVHSLVWALGLRFGRYGSIDYSDRQQIADQLGHNSALMTEPYVVIDTKGDFSVAHPT